MSDTQEMHHWLKEMITNKKQANFCSFLLTFLQIVLLFLWLVILWEKQDERTSLGLNCSQCKDTRGHKEIFLHSKDPQVKKNWEPLQSSMFKFCISTFYFYLLMFPVGVTHSPLVPCSSAVDGAIRLLCSPVSVWEEEWRGTSEHAEGQAQPLAGQ